MRSARPVCPAPVISSALLGAGLVQFGRLLDGGQVVQVRVVPGVVAHRVAAVDLGPDL